MESEGRKHPVHHAPTERHNVPILLLVTVCTKNRKKILADSAIHQWLQEVWQVKTSWLVGKYLLMPDHVHFFCAPGELHAALKPWMRSWKSHAARFWPFPEHTPVWQRDCWDTQLRREENYAAKWHYVEMNPVRAGLVDTPEEWPYRGELNELRW